MMTLEEVSRAQKIAAARIQTAGIVLTAKEKANLEIADFGLGEFERTGLALVVYENNERYCAKELALEPYQTCPEHRHPDRGEIRGKQETFRVRAGTVHFYLEGTPAEPIQARLPQGSDGAYTVFHEITLGPGEQFTLPTDTLHWFQAGAEGAVVSEFSSASDDGSDIFTDPRIQRETVISEA